MFSRDYRNVTEFRIVGSSVSPSLCDVNNCEDFFMNGSFSSNFKVFFVNYMRASDGYVEQAVIIYCPVFGRYLCCLLRPAVIQN